MHETQELGTGLECVQPIDKVLSCLGLPPPGEPDIHDERGMTQPDLTFPYSGTSMMVQRNLFRLAPDDWSERRNGERNYFDRRDSGPQTLLVDIHTGRSAVHF